jgi:phosphoribosylamine--glycine ligase
MKVLVVGGGGREHALCWRLAQSSSVTRVLAAPGNAGTAAVAERVAVGAEDLDGIVKLTDELDVDLTVIGPEAQLVAGLADRLEAAGRRAFGPSAAAARLEGSKAFAKDLMLRHGIPTARSGSFDDIEKATAFVDELGGEAVVKADGLAAGKGVTVARDRGTAVAALEDCLVRRGAAGGAGGVGVRARGRGVRPADRSRAGFQTGLRRRYGSEHRRDGCVLPARLDRPGDGGPHLARDRPRDREGHAR